MSTTRVFTKLSSSFQTKIKSISPLSNLFKSTSSKSPSLTSTPRFSPFSRLPVEVSCVVTMIPLHSAIASAKLQSLLAVDSQSWCLVPQVKQTHTQSGKKELNPAPFHWPLNAFMTSTCLCSFLLVLEASDGKTLQT